jgi:hypothetical protein
MIAGGPLPPDRPTACPCCRGRLVRKTLGTALLYCCDNGCPGVTIARALGLPLGDEPDGDATMPGKGRSSPRPAPLRQGDDSTIVPARSVAS